MLSVMDMKFPLKGHRTFPEGELSQSKAKIFKTRISIGVGRGRVRSNQTICQWEEYGYFLEKTQSICYNLIWSILNLCMDQCNCGHQFCCSSSPSHQSANSMKLSHKHVSFARYNHCRNVRALGRVSYID